MINKQEINKQERERNETPPYKPLETESFQAPNCTSRARARLG